MSKEKVKEMFAEVDEDGSGEIDFEEFLVLVAKQVYLKSLPMQFWQSKLLRLSVFWSAFAGTTDDKRQKFRLQSVQCRGWPSWKELRVNALREFRFKMHAMQVAAEGKKDPFVEAQKAFNMFDTDGSGICT